MKYWKRSTKQGSGLYKRKNVKGGYKFPGAKKFPMKLPIGVLYNQDFLYYAKILKFPHFQGSLCVMLYLVNLQHCKEFATINVDSKNNRGNH